MFYLHGKKRKRGLPREGCGIDNLQGLLKNAKDLFDATGVIRDGQVYIKNALIKYAWNSLIKNLRRFILIW